jgi:hypothetical protein
MIYQEGLYKQTYYNTRRAMRDGNCYSVEIQNNNKHIETINILPVKAVPIIPHFVTLIR